MHSSKYGMHCSGGHGTEDAPRVESQVAGRGGGGGSDGGASDGNGPYTALCLAGGGVAGVVYVGVLQELAAAGAIDWLSPRRHVQTFVGTSVGALFALLAYAKVDMLSSGTTQLVRAFLKTLQWEPHEFVRDILLAQTTSRGGNAPLAGLTSRSRSACSARNPSGGGGGGGGGCSEYSGQCGAGDFSRGSSTNTTIGRGRLGLGTGAAAVEFLERLLQSRYRRPNLTLGQLHDLVGGDLVLVATCVQTSRPIYFSHRTHPGVRAADAAFASMALPFLFEPYEVREDFTQDDSCTRATTASATTASSTTASATTANATTASASESTGSESTSACGRALCEKSNDPAETSILGSLSVTTNTAGPSSVCALGAAPAAANMCFSSLLGASLHGSVESEWNALESILVPHMPLDLGAETIWMSPLAAPRTVDDLWDSVHAPPPPLPPLSHRALRHRDSNERIHVCVDGCFVDNNPFAAVPDGNRTLNLQLANPPVVELSQQSLLGFVKHVLAIGVRRVEALCEEQHQRRLGSRPMQCAQEVCICPSGASSGADTCPVTCTSRTCNSATCTCNSSSSTCNSTGATCTCTCTTGTRRCGVDAFRECVNANNRGRDILIIDPPSCVSSTAFDLAEHDVAMLIECGRAAARRFLESKRVSP